MEIGTQELQLLVHEHEVITDAIAILRDYGKECERRADDLVKHQIHINNQIRNAVPGWRAPKQTKASVERRKRLISIGKLGARNIAGTN